MLMLPLPSLASMEFEATRFGSALLGEANGRGSPVGHTVRKLCRVASSSMVMFNIAAVPEAGTARPGPATARLSVESGPSLAAVATPIGPFGAGRVSSMRTGMIGMNTVAASGVADDCEVEAGSGTLTITPLASG